MAVQKQITLVIVSFKRTLIVWSLRFLNLELLEFCLDFDYTLHKLPEFKPLTSNVL